MNKYPEMGPFGQWFERWYKRVLGWALLFLAFLFVLAAIMDILSTGGNALTWVIVVFAVLGGLSWRRDRRARHTRAENPENDSN